MKRIFLDLNKQKSILKSKILKEYRLISKKNTTSFISQTSLRGRSTNASRLRSFHNLNPISKNLKNKVRVYSASDRSYDSPSRSKISESNRVYNNRSTVDINDSYLNSISFDENKAEENSSFDNKSLKILKKNFLRLEDMNPAYTNTKDFKSKANESIFDQKFQGYKDKFNMTMIKHNSRNHENIYSNTTIKIMSKTPNKSRLKSMTSINTRKKNFIYKPNFKPLIRRNLKGPGDELVRRMMSLTSSSQH